MIPSRFGTRDGANSILASAYGTRLTQEIANVIHNLRLFLKCRLLGSNHDPKGTLLLNQWDFSNCVSLQTLYERPQGKYCGCGGVFGEACEDGCALEGVSIGVIRLY